MAVMQRDEADERDEPAGEDEPAAAEAPASETGHQTRLPRELALLVALVSGTNAASSSARTEDARP